MSDCRVQCPPLSSHLKVQSAPSMPPCLLNHSIFAGCCLLEHRMEARYFRSGTKRRRPDAYLLSSLCRPNAHQQSKSQVIHPCKLCAVEIFFGIDVVILFSSVSAATLPSYSRHTEGTLISAACSCRTAQTSTPRKRSNSPLHDAECKICNILD